MAPIYIPRFNSVHLIDMPFDADRVVTYSHICDYRGLVKAGELLVTGRKALDEKLETGGFEIEEYPNRNSFVIIAKETEYPGGAVTHIKYAACAEVMQELAAKKFDSTTCEIILAKYNDELQKSLKNPYRMTQPVFQTARYG